MPLFGPRLDRPSAVGDEGRPRATSLTVASVLAFALLVATGHQAGVLRYALAVAGLAALVTLGLALLNRERFLAVFLGQLCYVLGGTGVVALVGPIFVLVPEYGLYLGGFATSLVGLSATWADVGDRESTGTALFQGGLSYVTMLIWFVVVVVVGVTAAGLWGFLTRDAAALSPVPSLITFAVAVFATSVFALAGLRWLPVRELTPRARRPALDRQLRRVRLATLAAAGVAVLAVAVSVALLLYGGPLVTVASRPPLSVVLRGLSTPVVVGSVLAVGLLVLLASAAALLVRRATRPVDARANRLLAGAVAGFAFTVLLLPFLFSYVQLPGQYGVVVAVVLVFAGPVALFLAGGALLVAVELDVLPDRAGGPALGAAGLVVATVGAALVGVPAPLVFACAAGAMVVWDVSSFGLGVTAELGHVPETRRIELFHGLLSVAFGVVVVAGLTALDVVRTSAAGELVVVPAVAVAVVGVLLLLVPVRG